MFVSSGGKEGWGFVHRRYHRNSGGSLHVWTDLNVAMCLFLPSPVNKQPIHLWKAPIRCFYQSFAAPVPTCMKCVTGIKFRVGIQSSWGQIKGRVFALILESGCSCRQKYNPRRHFRLCKTVTYFLIVKYHNASFKTMFFLIQDPGPPALHAPDSDERVANRPMTSWTFESGLDWKTLSMRITSMVTDNKTDRRNKELIHRKTNHSCRRAWLTVNTSQNKFKNQLVSKNYMT